jgi:hypothetical protein
MIFTLAENELQECAIVPVSRGDAEVAEKFYLSIRPYGAQHFDAIAWFF